MPSQMYQMGSCSDEECLGSDFEFPHLKTKKSSYGFTSIVEPPHTRRKESLFMGTEGMDMLQELQKKYHSFSSGRFSILLLLFVFYHYYITCMLYYVILYYIILYYIVLYYIILHHIILYYILQGG